LEKDSVIKMIESKIVWRTLICIALAATICIYLFHPAHETYGQDFFYYRSLAQLSRQVAGPLFYHSQDKLIAIESSALSEELRQELNWKVDETWVQYVVPRLPDPRFRSFLPLRYYPEWSSLHELSNNPYSKVSPATFGLLRVFGIDRLGFRGGYRIWNLVTLLSLLGSIFLLRKFAGIETIPFEILAVVALWFDPCRSSFVYGQFTEIALLTTSIFLYLRVKPQPQLFLAGVALGISIAIKPLAAGLLIFLIWSIIFVKPRIRAIKEICGVIAGISFVVFFFELLLGSGIWLEWLKSFSVWYGSYTYTLFSPANRSAAAALASWFSLDADSNILKLLHTFYIGAILLIYGWLFLHPRWRAYLASSPRSGTAMALIGPLLISKFVLIQYEVFLLVPFAVLLSIAQSKKTERISLLALILILWFGFGFYESFPFLLWTRPEFFLYPLLLVSLAVS